MRLAVALLGFLTCAVSQGTQDIRCRAAGYFPHPTDCSKFYRCVDWFGNGRRISIFHFDCPYGTLYDPNLFICNHADWIRPAPKCAGGLFVPGTISEVVGAPDASANKVETEAGEGGDNKDSQNVNETVDKPQPSNQSQESAIGTSSSTPSGELDKPASSSTEKVSEAVSNSAPEANPSSEPPMTTPGISVSTSIEPIEPQPSSALSTSSPETLAPSSVKPENENKEAANNVELESTTSSTAAAASTSVVNEAATSPESGSENSTASPVPSTNSGNDSGKVTAIPAIETFESSEKPSETDTSPSSETPVPKPEDISKPTTAAAIGGPVPSEMPSGPVSSPSSTAQPNKPDDASKPTTAPTEGAPALPSEPVTTPSSESPALNPDGPVMFPGSVAPEPGKPQTTNQLDVLPNTASTPKPTNPPKPKPTPGVSKPTPASGGRPTNSSAIAFGPGEVNFQLNCGSKEFLRLPTACDRFYKCYWITSENRLGIDLFQCDRGLLFDDVRKRCDSADKVGCPLKITTTYTVAPGSLYQCPEPGHFAFESDCVRFYRCSEDKPGVLKGVLYRCPENYGFSESTMRCEKQATLPECLRPTAKSSKPFLFMSLDDTTTIKEKDLERFFSTNGFFLP